MVPLLFIAFMIATFVFLSFGDVMHTLIIALAKAFSRTKR
jgi:hypothetical protein